MKLLIWIGIIAAYLLMGIIVLLICRSLDWTSQDTNDVFIFLLWPGAILVIIVALIMVGTLDFCLAVKRYADNKNWTKNRK